ncbi:MAG: alpha/beta fold hydrolase [Pseudomonadota bacterium]
MTECVELTTGSGEPTASVIWLHGLGADGHDFEPIVPELRLDERAIRFLFPHAPMRPVTINGGMSMRAWYDILTLDRGGPQDEQGTRDSAAILDGLIDREIERGVAANKIVVAGFSQGGAIALHGGLRSQHPLAGLIALSTYLPMADVFVDEVANADGRRELPIFMAHGTFDPVLPMSMGQESYELLTEQGYNVEWHDYPMAHAVNPHEIADIRDWLLRVLGD